MNVLVTMADRHPRVGRDGSCGEGELRATDESVGLDDEFGACATTRPEALVGLAIECVVVEEVDQKSGIPLSGVAEPKPCVLRFVVDRKIVHEREFDRKQSQWAALGVVGLMKR